MTFGSCKIVNLEAVGLQEAKPMALIFRWESKLRHHTTAAPCWKIKVPCQHVYWVLQPSWIRAEHMHKGKPCFSCIYCRFPPRYLRLIPWPIKRSTLCFSCGNRHCHTGSLPLIVSTRTPEITSLQVAGPKHTVIVRTCIRAMLWFMLSVVKTASKKPKWGHAAVCSVEMECSVRSCTVWSLGPKQTTAWTRTIPILSWFHVLYE